MQKIDLNEIEEYLSRDKRSSKEIEDQIERLKKPIKNLCEARSEYEIAEIIYINNEIISKMAIYMLEECSPKNRAIVRFLRGIEVFGPSIQNDIQTEYALKVINCYGLLLLTDFIVKGDDNLINNAIDIYKEGINHSLPNKNILYYLYGNLSLSYQYLFKKVRKLDLIRTAIINYKQAIKYTPDESYTGLTSLCHIGIITDIDFASINKTKLKDKILFEELNIISRLYEEIRANNLLRQRIYV